MAQTLPLVVHEHHEALTPHVDALAAIADAIGTVPSDELAERVRAEHAFIVAQLVPHMEQAELTLYPELERLLQNRHSMAPMRREHELVRKLVLELGEIPVGSGGLAAELRLRRILYRIYASMKVHLAEEEAYLAILERNLSAEESNELARGLRHATAEPIIGPGEDS